MGSGDIEGGNSIESGSIILFLVRFRLHGPLRKKAVDDYQRL